MLWFYFDNILKESHFLQNVIKIEFDRVSQIHLHKNYHFLCLINFLLQKINIFLTCIAFASINDTLFGCRMTKKSSFSALIARRPKFLIFNQRKEYITQEYITYYIFGLFGYKNQSLNQKEKNKWPEKLLVSVEHRNRKKKEHSGTSHVSRQGRWSLRLFRWFENHLQASRGKMCECKFESVLFVQFWSCLVFSFTFRL